MVGSLSVLPLFRIIELMACFLEYGDDCNENAFAELFAEDDLVQNLCHRSTHPSPLNRIKNMVEAMASDRGFEGMNDGEQWQAAR
jgi:hypothetical protein